MKMWLKNTLSGLQRSAPSLANNGELQMPAAGPGIMDALHDLGRWDELAAEITQEAQARVVIAGLPQSGKRLLLSCLRGWDLSPLWSAETVEPPDGIVLESYGSFLLADLSPPAGGHPVNCDELLLQLGDPALVLYVVEAGRGVLPADYRWVAMFRSMGRPVLVVLNSITDQEEQAAGVAEASARLGATVIPISTRTGFNVEQALLPALLNAVPRLAVPLGREIQSVRAVAARRVIRQTALFAGILGAQPIPLLDVPFQIMLQSGMVMRVGASFGHAPGGGLNREIIATVAGSLALHYLAQSAVKLVPFLGWAVGGVMASLSTLFIGEAAIQYYAAGGTIPFRQWLRRHGNPVWLRRRRGETSDEASMPGEQEPAAMMEERA